jgi:hypothetical protein
VQYPPAPRGQYRELVEQCEHPRVLHVVALRGGQTDAGCDVTFQVLDRYVQAHGHEPGPGQRFPGVAAHLRGCGACRQDCEGLLAAVG